MWRSYLVNLGLKLCPYFLIGSCLFICVPFLEFAKLFRVRLSKWFNLTPWIVNFRLKFLNFELQFLWLNLSLQYACCGSMIGLSRPSLSQNQLLFDQGKSRFELLNLVSILKSLITSLNQGHLRRGLHQRGSIIFRGRISSQGGKRSVILGIFQLIIRFNWW